MGRDRQDLGWAAAQMHAGVLTIAPDIMRPADVKRLLEAARQRFRRLDALANDAGAFTSKPLAKTTLEHWQKNTESNLTSLFLSRFWPAAAVMW
jgi:NADP-dependent 3-hydroxy acid dehydrogenase YdfG